MDDDGSRLRNLNRKPFLVTEVATEATEKIEKYLEAKKALQT